MATRSHSRWRWCEIIFLSAKSGFKWTLYFVLIKSTAQKMNSINVFRASFGEFSHCFIHNLKTAMSCKRQCLRQQANKYQTMALSHKAMDAFLILVAQFEWSARDTESSSEKMQCSASQGLCTNSPCGLHSPYWVSKLHLAPNLPFTLAEISKYGDWQVLIKQS